MKNNIVQISKKIAEYQAYRQELFDFCESRGFAALQSDLDELEDIVKRGLNL